MDCAELRKTRKKKSGKKGVGKVDNQYQEKLLEVRKDIDAVDKQLLPLLLKRMDCSQRVAAIKREAGIPVLNPEREQAILKRVREEAGEYGGEAAALYASIMEVSRARQYQLLGGGEELRELERTASRTMASPPSQVICQGVDGAYSHHAALAFFDKAPISFVPSFEQVFQEVESREGAVGILPVENSAAGSVTAVYDLILQYRFYIVGAMGVKVEHCLASAGPDAPIREVVSHPQAISQCSAYIREHGLKSSAFSNTAAAAKYVAEHRPAGVGAICSRDAAEKYGLCVLEEGIQNEKNNMTRFVVIAKAPFLPEDANKISLCFSLPHRPGTLNGVLQRFAMRGLNMTKIESRPIHGKNFEYVFYLDFSGNIHEKETLDLICSLHDELPGFSFLGNYSEK